MKLRKLSVLILGSAIFAGAASTSFAQPAHSDGSNMVCSGMQKMEMNADANQRSGESGAALQENRGKTRAQVIAEVLDARAKGLLDFNDANYPIEISEANGQATPGKTRAQVMAEVLDARAKGQLDFNDATYAANIGETESQTVPGKTREQMMAEVLEAQKQGLLSFNDADYPEQQVAVHTNSPNQSIMNMASDKSEHSHTC